MNTAANVVEIDRARNEIASLVTGLKANRIQLTRGRLLRVQTDLSVLISRISEAQPIISIYMLQRG